MDQRRCYTWLLKFRDEGIRFRTFMGRRWFIMKGLLLVFSLVFTRMDDAVVRGMALFLFGYTTGMIVEDVGSYFKTKKYWPYQKEVLNWEKIETLSREAA